jgi:hypothetical protein
MITVDTYSTADIRMKFWREYFDAGAGPNVAEGNGSSPTPPSTNTEIITRSGDTILTRSGDTIIARAN